VLELTSRTTDYAPYGTDILEGITPLILTFNEEPNIGRTLAKLTWAKRIVVVDSFSTDKTLEILKRYPQVELYQREFDDHSTQWNFGLDQVKSDWVLSLDADYVLSDELVKELKDFVPAQGVNDYAIPFRYSVYGRLLRATLYPPRVALFRAGASRYMQDGHTQLLDPKGKVGRLNGFIEHDDRKPLSAWLRAQDRYAVLEVQKLFQTPWDELPIQDKLRKMILPAPFAVFFYALIYRGIVLEGWAGWFYIFQRTVAETVLSLRMIEAIVSRSKGTR
jgi:glycosyltransferase involved in cell wall biosynthesis